MSRIAVGSGAVAVSAIIATAVLPAAEPGAAPSAIAQAIGTAGVIAWFLGAGASVLSLSTPFVRWGVAGLAMCGVSAAGLLALRFLGG